MTFATRPTWKKAAIAFAIASVLTACGEGGGGGDGDSDGTPSAVGTFVDAPVNGLAYRTSSGFEGTTGDAGGPGTFHYKPGEVVTFSLGGLTLGEITPAAANGAVVTPADIADGNEAVAANLMVLLQSLDSNDDEDVIEISLPNNVSLSGVNLSDSSAVENAIKSANRTPVSPDDALRHATQQFWNQVGGVWHFNAEDGHVVMVLSGEGRYLIGETGEADDDGFPSVEWGSLNWNPATRLASVSLNPANDYSGEWGLSHPGSGKWFMSYDGAVLKMHDSEDEEDGADFTRVPTSTSNPLIGAWRVSAESSSTPPRVFVFYPDDTYFMLDPVGDDEETACGEPGVEKGTYSYASGTLTVLEVLQDTNGCAGLNDSTPNGTGKAKLQNIRFSSNNTSFDAEVHNRDGYEGTVRMIRIDR